MQMGDKLTRPRPGEDPACWGRFQTEALECTSGPKTLSETPNAAEREVNSRNSKQMYIKHLISCTELKVSENSCQHHQDVTVQEDREKKTVTTKNFQNLLKNKKNGFLLTNEKSSQGY